MASEAPDATDMSSVFDSFMGRLLNDADPSLLFPFMLAMAAAAAAARRPDPEQENPETQTPGASQRLVLITPLAQTMTVLDGAALEALMQEMGNNKEGQPPASKASIEAMPGVTIGEEGGECVICLEQFERGGAAKEMPCKHRFHGGCIEKWLTCHGSCPVCRFAMPVEEAGKKSDGGERPRDGDFSITFYVHGFRRASEIDGSNQTPSAAHHDDGMTDID